MHLISSLFDALFATRCVRCKRLGPSVCFDCWAQMGLRTRQVTRVSPEGELLTGYSAIDFDDSVSELMHHLKEMGISALARPIGSALEGPLASLLSRDSSAPVGPLWLVPVASGVKSLQKRGYSPASLIGRALLASASQTGGLRLLWGAGLVWRQRDVADQAGLTGLARQTNLVGVMRASARAANKSIVLVDDIVTTGSTLFETARALRAEGAHVVGFVTFAETILRSFAKSDAGDSKKV